MTTYKKIFRIRGVDTVEIVQTRNPTVTQSTSENNTSSFFRCTIDNNAGENKDLVRMYDGIEVYVATADTPYPTGWTRIFNGFITNVKYRGKGSQRGRVEETVEVTAKDFYARFQDRTIEPTTFRNTDASSIVISLINQYAPDIDTSLITLSGIIVPDRTYLHQTLAEALNQLAQDTNRLCWVDVDKKAHFEQKGATASSVILESGVNILEDTFDEQRAGMANIIRVFGSTVLTRAPTYTFVADGIGSVITLPDKPSNTQVYINGSLRQGAVLQFATTLPTGVQYLVDYEQRNIVFVSGTVAGNNIPISGATGSVVYERSSVIARAGQDDDSITNYGPVEDVIVDQAIKTTLEADTVLNTALSQRADPFKQGTIYTKMVQFVNVAESVTVKIPYHNVDDSYTVLEVVYDLSPEALFTDTTQTIKVSRKIQNFVDTVKDILTKLRATNSQVIGLNQLLSVVRFNVSQVQIQDHYEAWTRSIGSSFVLGHPINGVLGVVTAGSLQPVLGSGTASAWTLAFSGGDF